MYRIAGHLISIHGKYPYLEEYCKDYRVKEETLNAETEIEITQEDIETERNQEPGIRYPDAYLEVLAALRKVAEWLPRHNAVLCHGAAVTVPVRGEEAGFIFMAPSGTGKTTHIRLWEKYLKGPVNIINGDKPFIAKEDGKLWIYGSPWSGKERQHKNTRAPLRGICFIGRGECDEAEAAEPHAVLNRLIRQIYMPRDSEAAERTLEMADNILKNTPAYALRCRISEEAVKCSFEALTGLKYEENRRPESVCSPAWEREK